MISRSASGTAFDPDLRFVHLTTEEGLSQSNVKCILQDRMGFMWFGTYDGLNKYDGYRFQVFQNERGNPRSLKSNDIYDIHEDRDGNLWIATVLGISHYNREKDVFDNELSGYWFPVSLRDTHIYCILGDSRGHLWFGTHNSGLYRLNIEEKTWAVFLNDPADPGSLSSHQIRSLLEDSNGNIWVGTNDRGLNLFHWETQTFVRFTQDRTNPKSIAGNRIQSIVEDSEHRLWAACYGDGLACIEDIQSPPPYDFRNYRQGSDPGWDLPSNLVGTLWADREQGVWIGIENGGLIYRGGNPERSVLYQHLAGFKRSLNNNSIYSIFQDRIGDLWVGTYAGGINVAHRTNQAFKSHQNIPGDPKSLSYNAVWGFQEDAEGDVWIATDGGGLNRVDRKTGMFESFDTERTNLSTDAILCVCIDNQDRIWVGTWAGGLHLFDRSTRRFTNFSTQNGRLPDDNIFRIHEDREGKLWLATMSSGAIRFDPDTYAYRTLNTENSGIIYDHIQSLAEDRDGNLYFGTIFGLSRYLPSSGEFQNYATDTDDTSGLSNKFITCIYPENDSTVWVGTMDGLNRLNPATGQFRRYGQEQGLRNNAVQGILKDHAGHLWISTNRGLSRFDPRTNRFKNYTVEDGLQGNEFIRSSCYRSKDGRLFFGGVSGFTLFNPADILENTAIPPIVLTDFQIFNHSVPVGVAGSPLTSHINLTREIVLSHRQSVFSIHFAALNFVSPSKNQYMYKLEGFDRDWNHVENRRSATYTNLGPNTYTFRVLGSNNDGVWNEEGVSLGITIIPPFWHRWWFRGLGVMLLVGSTVAWYRTRTARIRSQNRELESRVKDRTALLEATNKEMEAFSYSVSHDLRAPLRAMDGFSQALLEDYEDRLDETGKDFLHRIRAGSQTMSRLIDDLLKLSRLSRAPMRFERVDLGEKARQVIADFRRTNPSRDVDFRMNGDLHVFGDPSLLEVMLRNLLDNAWKFTAKRPSAVIEFGTRQDKDQTVYFVRDNGIGFDMDYSSRLFEPFQRQHTEYEGTGVGLTTVQRIIHRHGGRIWAAGEENGGATFFFSLGKFNPREENS